MSYHTRKNLRLKGYDYISAGVYFVTICVNYRLCLFGGIKDDEMVLNEAGLMIERYYNHLENKFDNVQCGEYVIMPNHLHCLIHIQNNCSYCDDVGCDKCIVRDHQNIVGDDLYANSGSQYIVGDDLIVTPKNNVDLSRGEHTGTPLPEIIQWFKTMTTNAYINGVKTKDWQYFENKLWQRNYYEHIVRNEKSYNEICEYIKQDALKWEFDSLNT